MTTETKEPEVNSPEWRAKRKAEIQAHWDKELNKPSRASSKKS